MAEPLWRTGVRWLSDSTWARAQARGRADIDDDAALAAHRRHRGLAAHEQTLHVNREDAVEFLLVDVEHGREELDSGLLGEYGLERDGYALLTLHRPSNVDEPQILGGILGALEEIQTRLPILFPAHPRTIKRIAEFGFEERLAAMPDLRVTEPLGYLEFLNLMAHARLMLTDSGGIQEETTILGIPCLTLRENTERPVTVTQGTNTIVGNDPERIMSEALREYSYQR